MNYCIIGNGVAATAAVEAIRELDEEGRITVISAEPYPVYSRPLITYLLSGKVDEADMLYRDEGFYQRKKVDLIMKRAVSIDTEEREVLLEDGGKVPFDKLLIATGGKPFVPEISGLDKEGVFTFTTWDDAKQISEMVEQVSHALVVGGGMIGLKATESLVQLGVKVTVVELADRVLSAVFDPEASSIMEEHLRSFGVDIITENSVEEIAGDGRVKKAILRDGREVECEMVIIAIGVRPNLDLVKDTGIDVNRGIVVDSHMETSIKGIFAAGDVAEAFDMLNRDKRPIPVWPSAYRQGRIAGYNMAGSTAEYTGGFSQNSIEVLGLPTISLGITNPNGGGYEVLKKRRSDKEYKKIVLMDDTIVGAIFIGCIDRAGIITGLIRDGINVKSFKKALLDDDFGFVTFPKELRMEKLR